MVTTSWSERLRRRGAMAQGAFLTAMDRAGFIEIDDPGPEFLHEFIHPDTGARRYVMPMRGKPYSATLPMLLAELEAARIACAA